NLYAFYLTGSSQSMDANQRFRYGARYCVCIIVPIVLGLIIRRIMPVIVNKSIRVVPLISVAAIIIIVTAVVAGNVDTLAVAGVVLFFAVLLHNAAGLLLGYVLGKIVRLKESDCR